MEWNRTRSLTVLNYPDFRVGAARTEHFFLEFAALFMVGKTLTVIYK
jgi:hypothetical protein